MLFDVYSFHVLNNSHLYTYVTTLVEVLILFEKVVEFQRSTGQHYGLRRVEGKTKDSGI